MPQMPPHPVLEPRLAAEGNEAVAGAEDWIARTADRESRARSYPKSFPIPFAGGEGHYLLGVDGRRYLDWLTGAGVLLLGHNHPRVVAAISDSVRPIVSGLDLVTTAKAAFLDVFFDILPATLRDDCKVHFCGPTGSDGIEAALKLARIATGRDGVIAFSGSYHGMTQGALGVTSNVRLRRAGLRARDQITFCPFPYPFRGVGPLRDADAATEYALAHLTQLLEDDHSGVEPPGLILLEVVQGEGGNIVASRRFLQGLRALCDKHGILLGFDEIQSGMGRTGRWFAFEHHGVMPDLFTVSKGVGGGIPLSLLVYRRALDVWEPGDHIGTFRGQQYAFAAGRALIETIREEAILEHVVEVGEQLRDGLLGLVERRPGAGEVRGVGLFLGLECVPVEAADAGTVARTVQQRLMQQGVLLERGGREGSVLRFLPPLTVEPAEVERVLGCLDRAFVGVAA